MKCSNCGTEFSEGCFCPECGTRIANTLESDDFGEKNGVWQKMAGESGTDAGEGRGVQEDKAGKSEEMVCPKCGERFETGLGFCPFCGVKLIPSKEYGELGNGFVKKETEGIPSWEKLKKEQNKAKYKWIIITALITVAVLGVVSGLLGFVSTDSAEETGNIATEEELSTEEMANEDALVNEADLEQADEGGTDTLGEDITLQNQEMEEETADAQMGEEVNPSYESWVGDYVRTSGPSSGISIWDADENGIMFAAGIGCSGYLAYRDIRDCNAEWIDDSTTIYVDGYGGMMQLTLLEDGMLAVTEERTDGEDILLLSGIYEKSLGQSQVKYEYVLPDSDKRLIMESDLENLAPLECRIARNEIYARHGRLFADEQLQNYFDCCTWYSGEITGEDFTLDMLSDIERENAEFISAYEEKMGYRQ